jgi:hypothetical protein
VPDANGKLTEEDYGKIRAWLGRHNPGGDAICPVCQSPNWNIAEYLVQPITLGTRNALQLGGFGYPQFMLISIPCGHTIFINAVISGVLQPTIPTPPQNEPKKD